MEIYKKNINVILFLLFKSNQFFFNFLKKKKKKNFYWLPRHMVPYDGENI